jgi:hypothetical protein
MMLISIGGVLLAWAAFIWLYDPDGLREPLRPPPRESRYWQEIDR